MRKSPLRRTGRRRVLCRGTGGKLPLLRVDAFVNERALRRVLVMLPGERLRSARAAP